MASFRPLNLLALVACAACAHVDATGEVDFAPDPETNYALGLKAVEQHRYLDAMQFFEHIRYRHPYSTVAALADLAIGDTFFEQDKFTEAAESYRNFVQLRPNHPKVDYAEFRIALSHYKDIPFDFFLFPPSSEKDQSAVQAASANFAAFLRRFPGSEHAPEAQKLLRETRERLVEHEMSVAAFYLHHDRHASAAERFERVADTFPDSDRRGEALFKLAEARLETGAPEAARAALNTLIAERPDDERRADAEKLLREIPQAPAETAAPAESAP